MKRSIFAFGVLGLVGCFLPMAIALSWFDLRHFDLTWRMWTVLAAFAAPVIVGASKDESERTAAIVGSVSFGYLAYVFGTGVFSLILHASIGGIMMGVAIIGGLASSLLALGNAKR
jgi:hypothetical protein